jgi:uncharacterized protein (TIGR00661 family)
MKKIIYYITDHGLGHATRAVALIRELQSLNYEIIVRTSINENFIQKSLSRIKIQSGITDVGPTINDDGMSIDVTKSKPNIEKWIEEIPKIACKEIDFLKKTNPSLVISDISAMPFFATKRLNITSLAISNFSWYDGLKFLSSEHLNSLKNFYDYADYAIKLPFGTPMKHFKNRIETGILTRKPTSSELEIREKFGLNKQDFVITIALGNSKKSLFFDFGNNCKIISFDKNIKTDSALIQLDNWIEGQDIISISNLVICKCGYGLISECVTNGIPFYYVYDTEHLEQKSISDELNSKNIGNVISLKNTEPNYFSMQSINKLQFPPKEKIDNKNIVNTINELLN